MRRKEERSKQGQTNNKAKQHSTPKAVTLDELPRVGLEPTILVHVREMKKEGRKEEACVPAKLGEWSCRAEMQL